MADQSPAVLGASRERLHRCTRCGSLIDLCAFCESADCSNVICYRCLRQELRQSLAQPHAHGG